MLLTTLRAMNSITSEVIGTAPSSAFARRIAMRVSRSGAVRSAMRPHSNRLRRRSSSVMICLGGRSELRTICLPSSWIALNVWKNSFLRPLLVGDELDVVDEEEVDPPVARPELVDLALLDARDELVGELLARRVDDPLARELGDHLVPDRVHQVGLAEAHAAVQEERVVGMPRALGHGERRRVGEPVGRPDDEVRERVARVEVGRAALATDPGRLEADRLGRRPRTLDALHALGVHAAGLRDAPPASGATASGVGAVTNSTTVL